MSHSHSVSDQWRKDRSDIRRRRLLFRSWHRGTQESDLILGRFADAHLAELDSEQLERLQALLDCSDADLFGWIIEGLAPPRQHDHDVMRLLRDFCGVRQRGHRQKGPAGTAKNRSSL
jgi:antitoxin CptB